MKWKAGIENQKAFGNFQKTTNASKSVLRKRLWTRSGLIFMQFLPRSFTVLNFLFGKLLSWYLQVNSKWPHWILFSDFRPKWSLITLCMKLPWFRFQLFCNCPPFVIGLVPALFLVGNQQRVRKLLSLCCCLKWLKIQTRSSLLGENELQQLSDKWRNKNTTYSTKHGL